MFFLGYVNSEANPRDRYARRRVGEAAVA